MDAEKAAALERNFKTEVESLKQFQRGTGPRKIKKSDVLLVYRKCFARDKIKPCLRGGVPERRIGTCRWLQSVKSNH